MKNSQLRIRLNRMSFTAHWKSRRAEVETGVASRPKRLAEYSQKDGWITHY
jgi:hypothetical protein